MLKNFSHYIAAPKTACVNTKPTRPTKVQGYTAPEDAVVAVHNVSKWSGMDKARYTLQLLHLCRLQCILYEDRHCACTADVLRGSSAVRCRDGMDVSGAVKVEVLLRNDLVVSSAHCPALDDEAWDLRRLSDASKRPPSQVCTEGLRGRRL